MDADRKKAREVKLGLRRLTRYNQLNIIISVVLMLVLLAVVDPLRADVYVDEVEANNVIINRPPNGGYYPRFIIRNRGFSTAHDLNVVIKISDGNGNVLWDGAGTPTSEDNNVEGLNADSYKVKVFFEHTFNTRYTYICHLHHDGMTVVMSGSYSHPAPGSAS